MATIHITQEEATRDLGKLLARVHDGDSFVIESDSAPLAILQSAPAPAPRLSFDERLARMLERPDPAVMDDDFARDVEEAMARFREPRKHNLWD